MMTAVDDELEMLKERLEKLRELVRLREQVAGLEVRCAQFADVSGVIRAACEVVLADHPKVSLMEIRGRSRPAAIVLPRHQIFWLSHQLGVGYAEQGRAWHRNHGTIMHGVECIRSRMEAYPDFARVMVCLVERARKVLAGN